MLCFGVMYCTEPTISFSMNMCRGALVDIASVEVTQPTQCQSELMAGCLLRCLSWHHDGRGAPANVMFVLIHGCLCMKEQKVKDDVSNTSHNDKTWYLWYRMFWLMLDTEPTMCTDTDVCRGASADIASVEVPQPTSCQSEFMAVMCMKEQKWRKVWVILHM